jgi:Hsp70 protein
MNVVALECKRCGGALPAPGSSSPFVTCPFCGTSHAVSAPTIAITSDPRSPSDVEMQKQATERAWDHAFASSKDPVVALRAVVAEQAQGLQSEQEVERAARLTQALVNGFDQENKTQAIIDKMAVIRIGQASVKAIIELRTAATTEVNLPFLIANETGPKHLQVPVPRTRLEELDAMGVYVVRQAAPPVASVQQSAPQESKPEKKRGWWPFG